MASHGLRFLSTLSFLLVIIPFGASIFATDICGTILTSTWTPVGSPYILTCDSSVASGHVLTLQAGTIIKFNANIDLFVRGELVGQGSAEDPIIFTANSATPTPGGWGAIVYDGTSASGVIKHANISYGGGGSWQGAVNIYGAWTWPHLDHVTITDSSDYAIYIHSTAVNSQPKIKNCTFTGNALGGMAGGASGRIFDATLNYWNAADGPGGVGPGSGQSVGSGFTYEPWLIGPPSSPHYFSSVSTANTTFNPSAFANFELTFNTWFTGNWTVNFKNSGGTVVRSFTGVSSPMSTVIWDGTNDSAVFQPAGNYTYEAESISAGTYVATPITGRAVISNTTLTISNVTASPGYFSPNGNGVQDTTTFSASMNYTVDWTLYIRNASTSIVRSATGHSSNVSFVWDGNDSGGAVQPDGVYTFELVLPSGQSATKTVTLDSTFPVAIVSSPTQSQVVSNVYSNGNTAFNIIGTATDANLGTQAGFTYQMWLTPGSNLGLGYTAVNNALLYTLETVGKTNGSYTFKLEVYDKAGNTSRVDRVFQIANFSTTQNVTQLSDGGSITYTSKVPFTLDQTISVKNESGQVVRTLFSGQRSLGTYNDVWDGKSASGGILPDGGYFITSLLTSGSSSYTWPEGAAGVETWFSCLYTTPTSDPFNNQPMTFSYNFSKAGRVTFAFSPTYIPGPTEGIPATCDPPNICVLNFKYQEAGPHTISWAGVDNTGVYRPDIKAYSLCSNRWSFAHGAVVLYGTAPIITNDLVTVTPPLFQPERGPQIVNFTVSSYQSQPVNITVTFLNQASLSTLRTITLNGVSPGPQAVEWDGTADNGMWVAPGNYTVTVTVTDSIGNVVKSQILTTVRY